MVSFRHGSRPTIVPAHQFAAAQPQIPPPNYSLVSGGLVMAWLRSTAVLRQRRVLVSNVAAYVWASLSPEAAVRARVSLQRERQHHGDLTRLKVSHRSPRWVRLYP